MKKIIESVLILIVLFSLFAFCMFSRVSEKIIIPEDNWNGGYCEIDGGRLHYLGTSNKEVYECEICHKIYKFNGVMKYKEIYSGK